MRRTADPFPGGSIPSLGLIFLDALPVVDVGVMHPTGRDPCENDPSPLEKIGRRCVGP